MVDLIASLQRLGDAEHDDLSIAHDALAEIMRLRLDVVEKQDEIERLRAALIAAMEIVQRERVRIAYNAKGAPPAIEIGYADILHRLDAVIAQAEAALGSER